MTSKHHLNQSLCHTTVCVRPLTVTNISDDRSDGDLDKVGFAVSVPDKVMFLVSLKADRDAAV